MKLIIIIMTTCLMQVSAASFAQKLTYNKKGATLEQIFTEIRKQTGYFVVFAENKVDKTAKLDVNFRNTELKNVLEVISNSQDLTYTFDDKNISLKPKESSFLDDVIARFQAIDVRGRVVDSLGNGLAGATVSVKGTKNSTSTAANGDFYLKNVDEGALLVVSYLGYITKETKVSKEFNYVQLQLSSSKLDEIQVIAYGITSQRLSTGNTTVIRAADIEKQPVNNPLYALQGRVPGLQVTPTTGLAGGAVNLQIRGRNSLNQSSDPLVVIDGMPVPNNIEGLDHSGYRNQINDKIQISALSFINPRDIESISVLKDADATSIYGSRGANGVILITTKKGKSGQTEVKFNVERGSSDVNRKLEVLNTPQYLGLRREALNNAGIDLNQLPWNSDDFRFVTADLTHWDQDRYTDWQGELIGKAAGLMELQGNISGGRETIQYMLSGNYRNEGSVFVGNDSDQKGNLRMSLSTSSSNQKFKASFSAQYQYNRNTLPGIDFTSLAVTLAPNAPALINTDGKLNWELLPSGLRTWENPYAQLAKSYESTIKNLIANGELGYRVNRYVDVRARFGFNDLRGSALRRISPLKDRAPEELTPEAMASTAFNNTYAQNLNVEPLININLSIGNGHMESLLGGSYQTTLSGSQIMTGINTTSDALIKNMASYQRITSRNNSAEYKYAAMFAKIGYNWKNKYLANFTVRRDGSSRFGQSNQFGVFGSGALAWILSEEKPFKDLIPLLSFAKLRASYGSSGNDGIGDYQYLERYIATEVTDLYQGNIGYSTSGLFNPYFAWEVTKKIEVGVELGLLSDRIFATGTLFRNRSNNQLIGYPAPTIAGPGALIMNLPANIQNSGMEFTLLTENIKSEAFTWATSFNIFNNRNKLLSYPNVENSPYYRSKVGKPFYGTVELYNFHRLNPQTGTYEFVLADGTITTNPSDPERVDRGMYLQKNTIPEFQGGLGNTFKYKNFSLDMFFQFTKQIAKSHYIEFFSDAGWVSNLPSDYLRRWRNPEDNSKIQKVYFLFTPSEYTDASIAYESSNEAYIDASFLRLKNASLGYSFPEEYCKKLKISQLSVYLLGQNLFTLTKYKGLDPETKTSKLLPPLRTVVFGLKVTL